MIVKTKKAQYEIIPEIGAIVNSEISKELGYINKSKISESEVITFLLAKPTDEQIMTQLSSLSSVALNITEDCNFRCKYCMYGGKYEMVRDHSKKSMGFNVAQKAADLVFKTINHDRRNCKNNQISFGFYGGEPLLEFELLKQIVEYIKKRFDELNLGFKFRLKFRINTNGYLLKSSYLDYLISNNFIITISLDGPKQEHDKFRVLKNGSPTWDVVFNNIDFIKKSHFDFFRKNVKFICTLHPQHDTRQIDDFFLSYLEVVDFFEDKVTINSVEKTLMKDSERHFLKGGSAQSQLGNKIYFNTLKNKLNRHLRKGTEFTGMCFPGSLKIFIDTVGNLNVCERIKINNIIGHVEHGFDVGKIRKIWMEWQNEVVKTKCWRCEFWFICNVCLALHLKDNKVKLNCQLKKKGEIVIQQFISGMESDMPLMKPNYLNSEDYLGSLI